MPNLFRALSLTILIGLLAGCKTVTIDEGFVFQPGQFGDPDAVRTSPMRYETIFTQPQNLTIDVWADGQTAQHLIKSNEFIKSEVTHDVIKSADEHIAITRVERLDSARSLVIHCGGNASDRYESGALYAQKIISFADVLMFDYPGYGESTGIADAQSLRRANQIIANYVKTNLNARRPLILWGHSLGGFVCADMVQHFSQIDGLILETTATNAEDVSEAVIPWYAKLFIRPRVTDSLNAYDMTQSLKRVDVPILILGAAKDKTLPVGLSQKLAASLKMAGRNVTYAEFPDGNHISVPVQPNYQITIADFFSRLERGLAKVEYHLLSAREGS